MLLTIFVTVVTIGLCNAIHFLALRQLAHIFSPNPPPLRRPVLFVSFAIFVIHLIEVAVYGIAMWFLSVTDRGALASLSHMPDEGPAEFFYFSIASYTTLGIGDIVPEGHLRILVGVEALQGLILIAWSASFTYLVMEKFWSTGHQDVLDNA